jgi:hypothetical protein
MVVCNDPIGLGKFSNLSLKHPVTPEQAMGKN